MTGITNTDSPGRGRNGKSAAAYRTISEVSEELDVPQHVLRFWETRFSQVRPLKRGGGRRYYRPEDVKLLRRIQKLLYEEGYTIKGVQKLLREGRVAPDTAVRSPTLGTSLFAADVPPAAPADTSGDEAQAQDADHEDSSEPLPALPADVRAELTEILDELKTLRRMLKG